MKKTSKFFAMLLMGAFAMGFTSCSDDDSDDNRVAIDEAVMEQTAQSYVNNVVYPTYTALAEASIDLRDKCKVLYQKAQANSLTDQDVIDACDAFKKARLEWERSEGFLFGPATDDGIDGHIDDWPLDRDQLVRALTSSSLINGLKGSNPGKFVYDQNGDFGTVIGFHGLEFVLFRNGAERPASAFMRNEDAAGMTSVQGIDELAFAAAVSEDICNMTNLLEFEWRGSSISATHNQILVDAPWVTDNSKTRNFGNLLLGVSTGNGYQGSWQETMQTILVGGCSNICQEVYTQKLGQAYNAVTNGEDEEHSRDYIESPYSKRSFNDYQDNIYSIKNVLYGTRTIEAAAPAANSIMSLMRTYNYPRYSALNNALNAAISALESAKNSGKAFVDAPGDPQVKTCIDAVNELDDELNLAGSWFRNNVVVVKNATEE